MRSEEIQLRKVGKKLRVDVAIDKREREMLVFRVSAVELL